MVVKVNTLKNIVEWRWINMLWVAIGAFALSIVWRWAMARRQLKSKKAEQGEEELVKPGFGQRLLEDPKIFKPVLIALALVTLVFPLVVDIYQTNIMVLALIFVVLGLGLNVTVGLAGLLDLGYVAFFAVGAYLTGILLKSFGFSLVATFGMIILASVVQALLFGMVLPRVKGITFALVTLGMADLVFHHLLGATIYCPTFY